MTADHPRGGALRIELPVESDEELDILEGALLAARAGELSQIGRRGDRLSFGYGSDSARESMSDDVDQAQRRWEMLDRLLKSIQNARTDGGT